MRLLGLYPVELASNMQLSIFPRLYTLMGLPDDFCSLLTDAAANLNGHILFKRICVNTQDLTQPSFAHLSLPGGLHVPHKYFPACILLKSETLCPNTDNKEVFSVCMC